MADVARSRLSYLVARYLVVGTGLLAVVAPCLAESAEARPMLPDARLLLAQQVVDGLPPPPPGSTGLEQPSLQAQAQQYMVIVNGSDPILLSQVQAVQPAASVQNYSGQQFIQAGIYGDLATAQQQVTTLSASGIGAEVIPVTSTSVAQTVTPTVTVPATPTYDTGSTLPPPEPLPTTMVPDSAGSVEFNSAPAESEIERDERGGKSYYVVIPSRGRDLDEVSEQVSRLTNGMGIDDMVGTANRHGSHVRVGPFNSRSAASRWTRYFRDFGMDARVNYGG
jgi:hypothetical protein